jgi:hypothetical protein
MESNTSSSSTKNTSSETERRITNASSSSKAVRFASVLSSSENERKNSTNNNNSLSINHTPIQRKSRNDQQILKVKTLVNGIEEKESNRKTNLDEFKSKQKSVIDIETKIANWMTERKKHTIKYDTGNGIYLYSLKDCSTASRIRIKEIWEIVLQMTDKDTLKKIKNEVKKLMNAKYADKKEIVFTEKKNSTKRPKIKENDEGIIEIN